MKATSHDTCGSSLGPGGELRYWTYTKDLAPTLERIRPLTMVPVDSLIALARQLRAVIVSQTPGDFVECGVWRGGASFLMADVLRRAGVRDRKVWLFDSFEGLPAPEAIDGPAAATYVASAKSPWYFDNSRASLEEVRAAAVALGLETYIECVKGWVEETLPAHRGRIGTIALLRIDTDWYRSVRCCLDHLYDQVAEGGFVILDDYYTFDGCAVAVHEFLAERRLAHRLESVIGESDGYAFHQAALFRKGGKTWHETWTWADRVRLAAHDLATAIPPGSTFIFVDQQQVNAAVPPDRVALPFLEKDGQYWGPPADDATALRELDRLRRAGASFIAFAWPAFWWLDHYANLGAHLRGDFRCVLRNDRVVIFDLGTREQADARSCAG